MDSIFNILSRKDFDLPSEVNAIKKYIRDNFDGAEVEVLLRGDKEIIISAQSSALVGSLRLHGPKLKRAADTDRRLVFRVG